MDDFIEILVYIVFILLTIVGSVYRNQQKKKEFERKKNNIPGTAGTGSVEMEERIPGNNFPPIFDFEPELIEEKVPQEILVETEVERSPVEATVPESIESEIEGASAFKSTESELLSDDLQEEGEDFDLTKHLEEEFKFEESAIEEESDFDFDPVKAVIYSEILNRRDY